MEDQAAERSSEEARRRLRHWLLYLVIAVIVIEGIGFALSVYYGSGSASRPEFWTGPILLVAGLALYGVGARLARRHDRLLVQEEKTEGLIKR